jgi:hypothetical protein
MPEDPFEHHRKHEDKHFYERDQELIKKLRAKAEAERRERERKHRRESHWMKCPKCGSDLEETAMGPVKADKCKECGGIYLDAGELDILLAAEKRGSLLHRLFERSDK